MPLLSVIIPTHKRAHILRRTLEHLEAQTIRDKIEVVVVSDGHDEETEKLRTENWKLRIHFFEIPKSHQGVARNKGVQEAKGEIILFIGDDIFLGPAACEKHLLAHMPSKDIPHPCRDAPMGRLYKASDIGHCAVLGFTTWDLSLEITKTMLWLERSGWQFGYRMLRPYAHRTIRPSIQHHFTYTSHISVPTEIAKKFPFREDVTLYGWEDIEWGMRLRHAGVQLFYEPDAHAYHHHHMTLETSLKRMETLGQSAVEMEKIVPSMKIIPRGWKRMAYQVISLLPTMRGRHAGAYLRGMKK